MDVTQRIDPLLTDPTQAVTTDREKKKIKKQWHIPELKRISLNKTNGGPAVFSYESADSYHVAS